MQALELLESPQVGGLTIPLTDVGKQWKRHETQGRLTLRPDFSLSCQLCVPILSDGTRFRCSYPPIVPCHLILKGKPLSLPY